MNRMSLIILAALFPCSSFAGDIPPLTIEAVAPGIYVHYGKHQLPNKINHGAIANIGFIVGNRCVAVIDTGGNPDQGYALKKAIEKTTATPVCYVINTHVHPDHVYGNIAFKQPGVVFVGHKNLPRALSMRTPFYLSRAEDQLGVKLTAEDIVMPERLVNNHMSLDLGGRKLTLTAHPTAHTDNDLTIYDAKTDTLWMSDLLFIEHIPVIDGSLKGWLSELQRLKTKKYKRVIPGHGPLVTDWPKSMLPELAYLQMLLEETRAAVQQGVFLEDAVNTVGLSVKDNWVLYDQFHKKNVTSAFAELEWED